MITLFLFVLIHLKISLFLNSFALLIPHSMIPSPPSLPFLFNLKTLHQIMLVFSQQISKQVEQRLNKMKFIIILKSSISNGPIPSLGQEGWRYFFRSLHGAVHQKPQVGGHQVHEEKIWNYWKSKETQRNTSPQASHASLTHHQTHRSPLWLTYR